MTHQGIDWPSWITAIATTLAFIAAGVAVYLANNASDKVIKLESNRDKQAKWLEEIDQATQISGWIASNPEIGEWKDLSHTPTVVAIVANPSPQPIFNVVAAWRYKGETLSTDQAHMIRPNGGFHTFHGHPSL